MFLKHINTESNHHKPTFRSIIKSISIRISDLFATEEIFNNHACYYNQDLAASGFSQKFRFIPNTRLKENFSKPYKKTRANIENQKFLTTIWQSRSPSIHAYNTRCFFQFSKNCITSNLPTKSNGRSIVWYIPGFALNVKGRVKAFSEIVESNSLYNHAYYSIFNRSTLIISYSSTQIIEIINTVSNKRKLNT